MNPHVMMPPFFEAGIGNFNVIKYTSVLPPESREITVKEAEERGLLRHGAVLETIMAETNGLRGDYLCAGVGRCWVEQKQKNGSWKSIGGFAVEEHGGWDTMDEVEKALLLDLKNIFSKRYGDDPNYRMVSPKTTVREFTVTDKFGTLIVALCFVSYMFPKIG